MPSAPLSTTAVVVVSYGSHDLLARNLAPVTAEGGPRGVVVDNLTTAQEREAVTALADEHGWTTVLPEGNTGFGRGVNLGVERALADGARTVVVLNPDATIARDDLERLVARVEAEPMTMVAPLIVDAEGRPAFEGYAVDLTDGATRSPRAPRVPGHRHEEWLTGACFAVSAQLWRACGGMAEDYFLYWEDVDLSLRVLAAGGALLNDTSVRAVHVQGGTQAEEARETRHSPTYYYWNVRNRLLLGAHWARRGELRRWVLRTPQESWAILMRGGRRQMVQHPALTLLPALRGARDGLRDVHRVRFGDRWAAPRRRPGAARIGSLTGPMR